MCRNRCQILGLLDEMSSFYGQLDLYKHSSTVDRKTLLTLNGGGSWARNFKLYSTNMEKTAFNVTGFIQPALAYDMLNLIPDADGLNDRQLFDLPPESELLLDDLEVPMPSDTPDLLQTFLAVYDIHHDRQTYKLEVDAYAKYRQTHDRLVHERLSSKNEDVQGILSKTHGYCASIAMVIHALEQALQIHQDTSDPWNSIVSIIAVQAASAIIHHFNHQKFIMLGLSDDEYHDRDWSTIHSIVTDLDTILCVYVFRKVHDKDEENQLWDSGVIGTDSPRSLQNAVFYYNRKNFCLRGGEECRQLKISQIQRVHSHDGYTYLEFVSKNRQRHVSAASFGKQRSTYLCLPDCW